MKVRVLNTGLFSFPLCVVYINRFFSLVGDYAYIVALSLVVAKVSPTAVMMFWIAKGLGNMMAIPFVGIIDHTNKKMVLITTDVIRGVLILTIPLFFESWFLFIIIGLVSFLGPFFMGAINPVITSLTNKDNRYRVNSFVGMISSASYFVGPLLGGILLIKSDSFPFIFQGMAMIITASLFFFLKGEYKYIEENHRKNDQKLFSLTDLWEGLNYIVKDKIIFLAILSNTLYLSVAVAIDAYEVLFLTNTLGFSDLDYSFALSYLGVAFIVAGFFNTLIGEKLNKLTLYIIGISTASISNLIFSLSSNILSVYASFTLLAIGLTLLNTALQTINQTHIPIEMQGKIVSIQSILPNIATVFSIIIAGMLLNIFSIRSVIITLALISILSALVAIPLSKLKIHLAT